MTDQKESTPGISSMEILATLKKHNDYGCTNVNWQAYLNYLKTPTNSNANDRSWMVSVEMV